MWIWLTIVRDRHEPALDVNAPINMDQILIVDESDNGGALLHNAQGVIIHVRESRNQVLTMMNVPFPQPASEI